jgi:hypothetical protein
MIDYTGPQRLQVPVEGNFVAPARRELVELFLLVRRIKAGVPLQVRHADVDHDVDALQLGQLLDDRERQGAEIVRIEQREVKAVRVEPRDDVLDRLHRRPLRRAHGRLPSFQARRRRRQQLRLEVRDLDAREGRVGFHGLFERDDWAAVDEASVVANYGTGPGRRRRR